MDPYSQRQWAYTVVVLKKDYRKVCGLLQGKYRYEHLNNSQESHRAVRVYGRDSNNDLLPLLYTLNQDRRPYLVFDYRNKASIGYFTEVGRFAVEHLKNWTGNLSTVPQYLDFSRQLYLRKFNQTLRLITEEYDDG